MNVDLNLNYFFKVSCELMCVAGADGTFKAINPAFEKMLGYSSSEIAGMHMNDFLHPDDIPTTQKKIKDFLRTGISSAIFLNRLRDKHGEYHWLVWNSMHASGDKLYAIGRDVTDIREKKDLLKNLDKKIKFKPGLLDTVLDSVPDYICLLDEQFRFIYANKFAKQLMGIEDADLIGKKLEDFGITYDRLEFYRSEILEVFRTGESFSNVLSTPIQDGHRDMEYFIIPLMDEGTVIAVIYTGRDITEKNKDKRKFEASEKKLKNIIDLVPYPIFLKNNSYKYTLINNAQAELFGASNDHVIGKTDEEFFKNTEELANVITSDKRILEDQVSVVLPEQIITDANGNKKILHTTKIPFFNEIENTFNILGISIDITSLKQSEAELLRTNFELDSFVYKSSHDLRAPLRSLMGLLNLAKKEKDPEMRNHILDRSHKSIVKLDTFILELTNFSRNSRVELTVKKIYFEGIIKECIENLKFMENAQQVQIFTDIDEQSEFFSDPGRIAILFMNLISNAIKYQNPNSTDPFVRVEVKSNAQQAEIIISDNGIGIEKEFHNKIFDMFFRASENSFGSGLGLYIVRQVVEKLNGKIKLFSEPDKGSTFTVVLPPIHLRGQPYQSGTRQP